MFWKTEILKSDSIQIKGSFLRHRILEFYPDRNSIGFFPPKP
ncbi:hypothetical protein LEP1GSC050_2360 [Leptospira broomii serovar Hurstbridge str. 5399]|uniref:Uncharacterized protein n=1 Tax=Leptospira broomii serovar Hurstbridge str. 5399 TaxID=1049789 RepID=T0GFY4_9LEPT|nr:hypothetical protein LEP1GSC050_2360 [Leptospira broomii serovar Hurstbridge str. 5399]